jgi:hypothetical protein
MRACVPVAGSPGQAYFWHGNKYAKVNIGEDTISFGPASVTKNWKTFAQAGFTSIDAAVETPGVENQLYVFSGTRYVRIQYVPGSSEESIIYGPYQIADQWKSLVKAGFDTIDAILPVSGYKDEAYFFSGNQYARIKFHAGSRDDEVVAGPSKIIDVWKTLDMAGFDTVDAAIAVPGHERQAYFFSGGQYVKVEYIPGTSSESILSGPWRIYPSWKCLAWGW